MTSRPATMAFVRALYHWYTGEERLAKAMLVVALAHAGCAGAAFTGELSSTSSTVDTTMLEPEAGMPEASPEIDASPNFAVIDAAPEAEAAPISVRTLPSNMSGFYEVPLVRWMRGRPDAGRLRGGQRLRVRVLSDLRDGDRSRVHRRVGVL